MTVQIHILSDFSPPLAFTFFVFIFVSWWKKGWKFSGVMPDRLLSFSTVSSQNIRVSKQWQYCPYEGLTMEADYFYVVSLVHGQDGTLTYVFHSCRIKGFLLTELFRQDIQRCAFRCSVVCRCCRTCTGLHISLSLRLTFEVWYLCKSHLKVQFPPLLQRRISQYCLRK